MSVRQRALRGAAWIAGGSWLQLGLSAVSFLVITSRLTPADVGLFGVAALLAGFAHTLNAGLFTDSLQQRSELSRSQINATFWISSAVGVLLCAALVVAAPMIAGAVQTPGRGAVITALALSIPLNALASTPGALLTRDLHYDRMARVGALSALVSSATGLIAVFSGAGVWSLVLAELVRHLARLVGVFRAQGFRPGAPRELHAITALMRFNLGSLGVHLIGYADKVAPRALAAGLLGAQGLGYLVVAERILQLLTQTVLAPMGAVTMASVARLQHAPAERNELIRGLYRLSTGLGYPIFLGAVVVAPMAMALLGPQWTPATLAVQLMLLVGLRTSMGVFNVAILRGIGQSRAPLILLGAGLALNLLLTPYGAQFGAAGVAAAVLIRTLATWPLGLWMIRRATGLKVAEQLGVGTPALGAALVMALATWAAAQTMAEAPLAVGLSLSVAMGGVVYSLAMLAVSAPTRRLAVRLVENPGGPLKALRAELRFQGKAPT